VIADYVIGIHDATLEKTGQEACPTSSNAVWDGQWRYRYFVLAGVESSSDG
jgi:hypothetical protein